VLRTSGEHEYGVPPLDLPGSDVQPPFPALDRVAAIVLFVQRAQAVAPGFSLTQDNARAVIDICRRVDGLPLAIELAAARVKLLTPAAILDRLERHVPVLATAALGLPARQRTLRATIEWSHALLEPAERRLLARLSAFAGGWDLEAAEEVCDPGGELGLDTLDGLSSLVDKSLIRAITPETSVTGSGTRFVMLQVIREYAGEKLDEEPDAEAIRRRHAAWMLALVEAAQPELRRRDLRRLQQRLRIEQENLRTALRWALDRGEVETGLRTAAAVWDFWHYWAEVREGIDWLEHLLEHPAAARPTDARARGLDALAGLVYWQGRPERAWLLYEEAVAIRRRLADDHALAVALFQSAWAAAAAYDIDRATARATEARDLFARADDAIGARLANDWIVIEPVIVGAGGDPEAAVASLQDAYDIAEAVGRAHDAADWLGGQAMVHRLLGDPERGLPAARRSIAAWWGLGNLGRLPLALKLLAALEIQGGRPRRAVRLEAAAQRLSEEVGGDLYQVFGQLGSAIEEARPLLTAEEHAHAVQEGRTLDLADQVAYALLDDSASSTGSGGR
jgi:non-specific serine/threonine protein kinase